MGRLVKEPDADEKSRLHRLFAVCAVIMTLILGLWIPSGIVSVSPEEFVIQGHYVDPNFFVLHSTVVAAGIFLLWFMIIFRFMTGRVQVILSFALWAGVCVTLVDYFFFSAGLGNMSATMIYDHSPGYTMVQKLVNMICIIVVITAAVFLMFR